MFFMKLRDGTNKSCTCWDATRLSIEGAVLLRALNREGLKGTAAALVIFFHQYPYPSKSCGTATREKPCPVLYPASAALRLRYLLCIKQTWQSE